MGNTKVKKVSKKRYERLKQKAKQNPMKFEQQPGGGILKNSKKLFTLKTPKYTEVIKDVMKEIGNQANKRFDYGGKSLQEIKKITTPPLSIKLKKTKKQTPPPNILQNYPVQKSTIIKPLSFNVNKITRP